MSDSLRARTVRGLTRELSQRWAIPDLADRVEVTFSSRLTRRLARALPERGEIRLGTEMKHAAPRLLREVICHELAHIAVYLRHGRRPKPHGREWQALIERAGLTPHASLARPPVSRSHGARQSYVHVCPVCQATRRAHRLMRRWRCGTCVARGLDGTLVIERGRG